jgi:hypothetical protein
MEGGETNRSYASTDEYREKIYYCMMQMQMQMQMQYCL